MLQTAGQRYFISNRLPKIKQLKSSCNLSYWVPTTQNHPAKWAIRLILRRKTARFAAQNESFCRAKRAFFACRMSHFESPKNVKKTQVVFSQCFRTFSYFARTRPSAFYFGKMACISYNKCYFVSIIQHLQSHQLQREKTKFLHYFLIPNWRSGGFPLRHWKVQAWSREKVSG